MNEVDGIKYAGFWLRFVAYIIDAVIVSLMVFPFALILGVLSPQSLLVEVPFNLFTSETTLSEESRQVTHSDDSVTVVTETVVRDNVLGLWEYHYKVTTEKNAGEKDSSKQLIDPETGLPLKMTTSGDIEFYVIFIYWILLEASRQQGSIGKMILGITVVNASGGKPELAQAAGRNLLKILSE